ncbi:disease resistance protein RPV1-like [Syzygium oleosum]|uniref:disease resistance protein RPV1-like n=1 Tax=Syzygium oleosum TaxID=219896 RepID=UPI0024BBE03B|nr:disease resistance protein RPV1-like [Syzygium oleosum]
MSTDYEVFLSFRGPDTHLTFTDCLYEAMNDAGICVFRDDEEPRFGEASAGYASSVWCLQELAHMVECKRSSNEKEIFPIFYNVEVSDVKLRTDLYDNALKKHKKKFGYEKSLHDSFSVQSQKFYVYEMREMRPEHAPQLFSMCAFRADLPPDDYNDLLSKVVATIGGLPLALEIVEHDVIWMHDQIQDLGREIVRQESFQIPERCSRSWSPKVGLDAARKQEGTENVVALVLWGFFRMYEFRQDQFSKLPNLRLLELHEGINFVGDFENHLSKLRWLSWHSCHPKFNATNFNLRNLVVLNLSKSELTEDWGGWSQIMMSSKFKVLNLTSCRCLTKTPDFSSCLALERLTLKDCESLVEIDSSIGKLQHLTHLTIDGCNGLRKLPDEVISIRSLTSLVIKNITGKGTNSVKVDNSVGFKLPELIGNLKYLSSLQMVNVRITDLPCSIGLLKNIKSLSFYGCSELKKLSDSMGALPSLVELDLSWTKIAELPESFGHQKSLSVLELDRTPITKLPSSIGGLIALQHLVVSGCLELTKLPNSIGELKSLLELDLSEIGITELPDSIGNLKRLKVIKMNSGKVKKTSHCYRIVGES